MFEYLRFVYCNTLLLLNKINKSRIDESFKAKVVISTLDSKVDHSKEVTFVITSVVIQFCLNRQFI